MENVNFLLPDSSSSKVSDLEIKPIPYTFTKIEKGKKMLLDQNSVPPPSWSLLDHTIAVVWLLFSSTNSFHQLNINDLKWAHEFLKEIRNNKGENPPDVKTCIKEIQDRLIDLYANLTSYKNDVFDDYSSRFGETMCEEIGTGFGSPRGIESKQLDRISVSSSLSPSRTSIRMEYPLHGLHSSRDMTVATPKSKRLTVSHSKKMYPIVTKNSNIFEDAELEEEEGIEKFLLNLLENEKKEDNLQSRSSTKSLIPTKKKMTAPSLSISELISNRDFADGSKEKNSKKFHCTTEMTACLQFQKSLKLQDKNGEEAAYSNLKTEIRRLTIDPKMSKNEIKKFLKKWRSEHVEKLHNDLNRLNSIEEILKGVESPTESG